MTIIQKLVIFVFFSGLVTCKWINIQNINFHNSLKSHDILFQILKLCNKNYKSIAIVGDINNADSKFLRILQSQFSIILHSQHESYQEKLATKSYYEKKIDAVVMITKFQTYKTHLRDLFSLRWLKVAIPIYTLRISEEKCKNIHGMLSYTLGFNVLTAYVICFDEKKILQIYTYNPFSNQAPSQWTRVRKLIGIKNKLSGVLYRRKYEAGDTCHNYDFDRTKHLDGYQIKISLQSRLPNFFKRFGIYIDKSNLDNSFQWDTMPFFKSDEMLLQALTTFFNVTLEVFFNLRKSSLKVNESIISSEALNYINESTGIDLVFLSLPLGYLKNAHYRKFKFNLTYPVASSKIGIVTYNRGYQTLIEKLLNFYGIWTVLFTFFILSITFIVIWYVEKQKSAFASFEIIRLLTNHSLYTRMNTFPLKIFFGTIFIYFIMIQATFQGHLAKFLTQPKLRKHAETLDDLDKLNLIRYNAWEMYPNVSKSVQEKLSSVGACINYILSVDHSTACIDEYEEIYRKKNRNKNLYINKKPFSTSYKRFLATENWNLQDRFGILLLLLQDLGFWKYVEDYGLHKLLYNDTVVEERLNQKFRPVKLENVTFCFIILGVGLTSAIISFFVEIYIDRQLNLISNLKNILQRFMLSSLIKIKKLSVQKNFYKRNCMKKNNKKKTTL